MNELSLTWEDGNQSVFPALWLFDNQRAHRDPSNQQRLIDIADLPSHLQIRRFTRHRNSICIEWAGDYPPAQFDVDWLHAHDPSVARLPLPRVPWLSPKSFFRSGRPDAEWLDHLIADGIALITRIPTEDGAVLDLASRIGIVTGTNYGRIFDVRAVANPENLAYTDRGLGLHTDNPYRDPVPGFQVLHVIQASREGGDSLFADGLAIAEHLRANEPEMFSVLTTTPVRFEYQSSSAALVADRYLIELLPSGGFAAIHYNSRSIAPLRLPPPRLSVFYAAYRRLAEMLRDPRFIVQTKLQNGEAVVFDNRRVLHGRTAFSATSAARHLQGCYLSNDSVLSTWRLHRQTHNSMTPLDEIQDVFQKRGAAQYSGEKVSQLEHALQAARLAEQSHGPDSLIGAALLHDIGHLLHHLGENIADAGIDTHHEAMGQAWLARHFPPEVTEPVRLHVAAKRYLCAVEPAYLGELSPASVQSLALQGGPMSLEEVREFESNPFFREAVKLRRFDDEAKIEHLATPDLHHYRPLLSRLLQPPTSS